MNISQLISFAHAYSRLGWSVQEQLQDFMNGERDGSCLNVNAVDMCADLLKECDNLEGIDGAMDLLEELNEYCAENS